MQLLAYAKLNLFLDVIKKRKDGYHEIITGVTFVNLHDKITILQSKKNSIFYTGPFAPKKGFFEDDIINKVLDVYKTQKKEFFVEISIEKNIPFGSGLGGASADAAALLKGLERMNIINSIDDRKILNIGADVQMCMSSMDCIASGIGDRLNFDVKFPKYYFLLLFPNFSLSTREVYLNYKKTLNQNKDESKNKSTYLNPQKYKNDLMHSALKINPALNEVLKCSEEFDGVVFNGMTGSGSCFYSAFTNKHDSMKALVNAKAKYPQWWVHLVNNKIES